MVFNGIIIQDLRKPIPESYISILHSRYKGIHQYYHAPLLGICNEQCKKLTDEAMWQRYEDGTSSLLEFISSLDLAKRYINECENQGIPIRILFAESDYAEEIWKDKLPKMKLLGYEYLEIPFDTQIITDLDWCQLFHPFHTLLNENGLFNSIEDAQKFKECYDKAFREGTVGDGETDNYILKVYEIEKL